MGQSMSSLVLLGLFKLAVALRIKASTELVLQALNNHVLGDGELLQLSRPIHSYGSW
jgi:hypothetical protein